MQTQLTTAEAAKTLGLSHHTVSELCRTGAIRAFKRAGRWFLIPSDVRRYSRLDRRSGPKKRTAAL